MIPVELTEHQRQSAAAYLGSLHERCVRRFRDAALLIGADLAQWPGLKEALLQAVDLGPLLPFWASACEKYNRHIYEPQYHLLDRNEGVELPFSRFIYWKLWPIVASERECVRNVLRAVATLPAESPNEAARALVLYIAQQPFDVAIAAPDPGYFE